MEVWLGGGMCGGEIVEVRLGGWGRGMGRCGGPAGGVGVVGCGVWSVEVRLVCVEVPYIIIIIKRRSGINPIPPTVIDRD